MTKYTRTSVNLCAFFITVFIFCIIYLFPKQIKSFAFSKVENPINSCYREKNFQKTDEIIQKEVTSKNKTKKLEWKIVIPAINLDAQIAEGTSPEILNKYVGHFENTPKLNGNVALGAHNRGYKVNYFKDLKKLKKGDKIQYYYNGKQKEYQVETITIIKDTDWTYLQNTTKDKITLITCVEDQPEYRRCIQGAIVN